MATGILISEIFDEMANGSWVAFQAQKGLVTVLAVW